MEDSEENVIGVTLECLDATLAQVVPYLDGLVVVSGYEIGFICAGVEVNIVNAFLVGFHCEVWSGRTERPHLDCAIETGSRESVGVLWVNGDVHDVVGVAFVGLHVFGDEGREIKRNDADLDTPPLLIPIPSLDCHVVTAG